MVSRALALFKSTSPAQEWFAPCSPLLAGDRSSLKALLFCYLTGSHIPQNPNLSKPQQMFFWLKLWLQKTSIDSLLCAVLRQRGFQLIKRTVRRVLGKQETKASWIQNSRIGSALLRVRRNAQRHELNLLESPRFMRIAFVSIAVSTSGPSDFFVSPPPLLFQNVQPHRNSPHTIRPEVKHQPFVWRWARIVRARKESRVKLVGYKIAE